MDRDWACSEIVHLAHHAASAPELWNQVALGLRQMLRAQIVGFFEHDILTGKGDIPYSSGLAQNFRALYQSRFAARNGWFGRPLLGAAGEIFSSTELVPNWELVRSDFYLGWLRPQGALHGLIGVTFRGAEGLRCFVALRPLDGVPFGSSDKALLAPLLPHLQCASRLSAEVAASRHFSQVLLDLLSTLPLAAMIVDDNARLMALNRNAERLLAQRDGLSAAKDAIAASSAAETALLRRSIATAAHEGAEGKRPFDQLALERPSGGPPLLVQVLPLAHPIVDGFGRKRSVVALVARQADVPDAAEELCRFYRMTPAEARLAALIVSGHSLIEATAELGITKNTARTHMKRIYAKTDTHRQTDLVRLLAMNCAQLTSRRGTRPTT